MKPFLHLSTSLHSAVSLLAVIALACGSSDEDAGSSAPPFTGGPGATPPPGSPGPGPVPVAPSTSSPDQPSGIPGEAPVTNGETPLAGGESGTGSGSGSGGDNPTPPGTPGAPGDPAQPAPQNPPPRPPGGTPNLFTELLGRSQAEVDAKVQTAVDLFFGIGSNDPATPTLNGGARSFYTLPQDPTMGFIWAADSADIRSEGMS